MRISGMKTGLDVENLVKQLMQVERRPVESLRNRITLHESKASAWQNLSTKLAALKDASDALKSASTWAERQVTVTDTTIAAVTATQGAPTGNMTLNVTSLATAQRAESGIFSSNVTALGYSGTVIVDGASIVIAPEDTLEGIANKIVLADIDATCRVVKLSQNQFKLVITSTTAGQGAAVSYQDSGPATYSVDSSNPAVVQAVISGTAAAGEYALSVSALAQAETLRSDVQAARDVALGLEGTFTLNGAAVSALASDSLDNLATKINATHAGVQASVVTDGPGYRLEIVSETMGKAGVISFADGNGVLRGIGVLEGNLVPKNVVQTAADAAYSVNGTAYSSSINTVITVPGLSLALSGTGTATVSVSAGGGVLKALGIMDSGDALAHEATKAQDAVFAVDGTTFSRAQNTISDAVQGLTLTLKRTGSTAVELSEASGSLLGKVKDWVAKYNDIVSSLKAAMQYDAKSKTAGPLNGDLLAGELYTKIRLNAMKLVPGLTPLDSLDDVGIATGRFGSPDAERLVVDEAVLSEKMSSARLDVMRLFGAPTESEPYPTNGIARDFSGLADSYVHSQTGLVPRRETMIESSVESLQKQVEGWEDRLARREMELFRKYTQMEVQLSRMQNQMAALGASLDKLI